MSERSDRLDRLRRALTDRGLDGGLISHPANRFYLSGYSGADVAPDGSAGVLLVSADSATLLTGATNVAWAEAEAGPAGWEAIPWERPWEAFVGDRVRAAGWHQVGIEESALTVAAHRRLTESLGAGVRLVPLDGAVEAMRIRKDAVEVGALTAALAVTDEVFVACTADLTPGITERQLAWRIERTMRERGADGPAFPTIVAGGPHAARPHHAVTDRPLAPGEPIIIDMGASLGGYHGDLTRTLWIGEPTDRLREVYNVVYRAQRAGLAAIRPGARARDVDAVARAEIVAAGFGEQFVHGLGHGLGVRVHEAPSLAKTSDDVLQPGAVVTIEPGVYLAGWGGVRIEDVVVIEETGVRVVTAAPKAAMFE